MGSTRFPGKILKKVGSYNILDIHIKRVLKSKKINSFLLATTKRKKDDDIIKFCLQKSINYFRGSEKDVLDRFYRAAKKYDCDYVIRLTSDCPLIDPKLIDKIIKYCINNNLDYCSNTLKPTYPDGQDIEIFKMNALYRAWEEAKIESDREHVTPYIWRNSTYNGEKKFKSDNFDEGFDYSNIRMTVDNSDDLKLIRHLVKYNGINCAWFDYANFINKKSNLYNINSNYVRNEGYLLSLENDNKAE